MATMHDLTLEQQADLEAVLAMRDEDIDFSDIPEVTDFSGFHRPEFYLPIKQPLTLRLDDDVVAWFQEHASKDERYQTAMNRVLRDYVAEHERSA